ncbi:MAG: ribonuclease III [Alphaproteobacteria bacterium]|nr:ribonuclease III [Rickettsiales bacterium]
MSKLEDFTKTLGYSFQNKQLLISALTHPSIANPSNSMFHYERLELLGDAILGFVMKEILFYKHPNYKEGALSQKVSLLISREYCYKVGILLDIPSVLCVSKGEEKNNGRNLKNNIANTVESVLAAVYLDADSLEPCKQIISTHWKEFLDLKDYLDPKTILQEWSQSYLRSLPRYDVISSTGPDHKPKFIVSLTLDNGINVIGEGSSKKIAEKEAAHKVMQIVGK